MRWITALQLGQWAETISARTDFPKIIADLIRASVKNVIDIRFPNGDKGQVRGFDGVLDTEENLPYVPGGKSVWELGVNGGTAAKAESDYKKRTKEVDESIRKNATFVLVSPRTWDGSKLSDWVENKNAKGEWKKVIYIDGSMLEDWFDMCPAVSARYARSVLKLMPEKGVRCIDEFWEEYSTRFDPPLVEDVLLAGREAQAHELIRRLIGGINKLQYAADNPDEVVAFAIAAIRRADPKIKAFIEAKALVIDTEEAIQRLAKSSDLIFLPRGQAQNFSGLLVQRGPTLVSAGGDDKKNNYEVLVRPNSGELAKALVKMGFPEDESLSVARRCGRSLTVLARQHSGGKALRPEWLDSAESLIPALLAGAWHVPTKSDQDVMCKLATVNSYADFEAPLRKLVKMQDPPLDHVGDVWGMRASVDAFVYMGHLLGTEHLDRFVEMAEAVFSQIIVPPKAEDIYKPRAERVKDLHSEWLRDGMMSTLLHMAVLHEQADFTVTGSTPQDFVNGIIRRLPGLSSDHRLLASLQNQTALLAEAAPTPFLEALEHLLEGDAAGIRPIFDEYEGSIRSQSFHCGLLWGLEMLAWDPTMLLRVSLCLARLAEIDPGGSVTNRPINSLRAILLTWAPNTYATTKQRTGVLKQIVREVPAIAWQLLTNLLPTPHDISQSTQKPLFREFLDQSEEILTYGLVWESQLIVINMSVELAGHNPERWKTLIEHMSEFPISIFEDLARRLELALMELENDERFTVWDALRKEVNKHRTYSSADWALKEDVLGLLDPLIDNFKPQDIWQSFLWLFNDWNPDIPHMEESVGDSKSIIATARKNAVQEILQKNGLDSLIEFSHKIKIPHFFGSAVQSLELDIDDLIDLFSKSANAQPELGNLMGTLLVDGELRFGEQWMSIVRDLLKDGKIPHDRLVNALSSFEDGSNVWQHVEKFGTDVWQSYWKNKHPYYVRGTLDEVITAITNYLVNGRPLAALSSIAQRLEEVPSALLVQILNDAVKYINSSEENINFYDIEQTFEILRNRTDLSEDDLARLEFSYLPVLVDRQRPLTLHLLLAKRPSMFMEIICAVFLPASGEHEEISENEKMRISACYKLLKSFDIIPGQKENEIDEKLLLTWCAEVQRIAREVDRVKIVDQSIGALLAHAPNSPLGQEWPHESVRSVIEVLRSEDVEQGIMIERFNMRGVFTKMMGEGGDQERELAQSNRHWADSMPDSPRTAAMLIRISENWLREATREDISAAEYSLRS